MQRRLQVYGRHTVGEAVLRCMILFLRMLSAIDCFSQVIPDLVRNSFFSL